MDTKKLRQKILDLAIHGKLVPQDPNDEPASVLLERIHAEKDKLIKEGKIKAPKKSKSAGDTSHYPKDVPFEVPEGWAWCTLADIGKWQSGATPSRGVPTYYGGTIPWLKTGDLNDSYITDIPEYITEKALQETSVKMNPAGSVLIAMYGATIGKVGILTFPATTNQACCACSEFVGIDNKYLFYFLISHKDSFITKAGGGAQPNISKEIIVNTYIPIPPINEQERIVEAIEKWIGFINEINNDHQHILSEVEDCKSKILDLAIHGKLVSQDPAEEPAIALLSRINPSFFPAHNLHYEGDIPKKWTICTLADVTNYGNCVSVPISEIGDEDWVLELEDIEKGTGRVIQRMSKKSRILNGIRYRFYKGQVLYSKLRTYLNKVFVADDNGFCTTEIIPITTSECILPEYLNIILRSPYFKDYSARCGYGVKMPRLGTNDAKKALIPLPPLPEQVRIIRAVDEWSLSLDKVRNLL